MSTTTIPAMSSGSAVTLVTGKDKNISPLMQWSFAGGLIERKIGSGSVNASSFAQRSAVWRVRDNSGQWHTVPRYVHKHERTIAKWYLSNRKEEPR